jgi:hypothetical protein
MDASQRTTEAAMRMTMAAALTVLAMTGAVSPVSADMVLIRGSFAESVPTGHTAAPVLLRGARPLPASAVTPVEPAAPAEEVRSRRAIAGGRVLWLADEAHDRLQACWLRGTGAPGGNAIVCTVP